MKGSKAGSSRSLVVLVTAVAGLLISGPAASFVIETDDPDLNMRWDNTLRYNLGMRAQGRDSEVANNATYDESDFRFDRGDIVTNRLDLLSEFDLIYRQYHGFRVSAAAWYDHAYRDDEVRTNPDAVYYSGVGAGPSTPSYDAGRYSGLTKRYHHGPSGELLDAFAFTRVNLGGMPLSLRAGRHVVYWGEGLLIAGHAISYSQAPVDGRKAVASPGTETREVFRPLAQLSGQLQVNRRLSVGGQYLLEWDSTRAPEGGTYLGSADVGLQGPDQLPIAPGFALPFVDPLEPDNQGNWGVFARYDLDFLHSTLGAYYREFDEYAPWGVQTDLLAGTARYVYARDVSLYGLSWSAGPVLGGATVGVDLSYRKDSPLVSTGISLADDQGARGDTWHLVSNAVWLLPSTPLFDTGSLVVEGAYSHLARVTHNENLYKEGGNGCVGGRKAGCATDNYLGLAVNFTPEWLNVIPRWDLAAPISIDYGVSGNAAAGGGNQGAYRYSIGLRGTFDRHHEVRLSYIGYHAESVKQTVPGIGEVISAGSGNVGLNDRGWISLSVSMGF